MDIDTYTGNGTTHERSEFSFSPDFVWIKRRNGTNWHQLFDTVRGATKRLYSNETNAENTASGSLDSFDSDGFTLGSDGAVNSGGSTYVAWAWDGGSAFSNSAGSNGATIASSGVVNATAGFSIATYTGSTGNQKFCHGLGAKPAFILIKNRSSVANWFAMIDVGSTYFKYGHLNSYAALADATSQPVDSSTVTLGNNNAWYGANNDDYLALCWAPIEGYSSFGLVEGNGSADGPFIYTGFKPAFVRIKALYGYSGGSDIIANTSWYMYDNARSPFNPNGKIIAADLNNDEEDNSTDIDFLSNGFKIRNTRSINTTNNAVYMAFAEHPFKYSRAA